MTKPDPIAILTNLRDYALTRGDQAHRAGHDHVTNELRIVASLVDRGLEDLDVAETGGPEPQLHGIADFRGPVDAGARLVLGDAGARLVLGVDGAVLAAGLEGNGPDELCRAHRLLLSDPASGGKFGIVCGRYAGHDGPHVCPEYEADHPDEGTWSDDGTDPTAPVVVQPPAAAGIVDDDPDRTTDLAGDPLELGRAAPMPDSAHITDDLVVIGGTAFPWRVARRPIVVEREDRDITHLTLTILIDGPVVIARHGRKMADDA